jgi:hypothetical protein
LLGYTEIKGLIRNSQFITPVRREPAHEVPLNALYIRPFVARIASVRFASCLEWQAFRIWNRDLVAEANPLVNWDS